MEINEQGLIIMKAVIRVANILKYNPEKFGFEEIEDELNKRLSSYDLTIIEAQKRILEILRDVVPVPGSLNIEMNLLFETYEFVEFFGEARDDGFGIFYPPRRVIVDS